MLPTDDRALFTRVEGAAFANPFGETRAPDPNGGAVLRGLWDATAGSPGSPDASFALARLGERLAAVSPFHLSRLPPEDRRLVETALLFDLFHRNAARLDFLVEQQRIVGETPVHVTFADEVVGALVRAGFPKGEALRHFARFFQLRRAFLFLGESIPGGSASMRRLRERLWNVLFTCDPHLHARALWRKMEDFSTLLVGESGTGKGTVAAVIGRAAFIPYDEKARRFAASFEPGLVSIDLSHYPVALVEAGMPRCLLNFT